MYMYADALNVVSMQQILISGMPTMDKAMDLFGWTMCSVMVQKRDC